MAHPDNCNHQKDDNRSAADKAYEHGLTASASVAIILLSFSGALSLPLWLILICSGTSALEYQIFYDNIREARRKLNNEAEFFAEIEKSIARRVLHEMLSKKGPLFNSETHTIINEEKLIEELIPIIFGQEGAQYSAATQILFKQKENDNAPNQNIELNFTATLGELGQHSSDFVRELTRKKNYIHATKLVSALSGLSCGFVFLYSAHYGIEQISFYFAMTLSAKALLILSAIIFPIAACLVAAAYFYVTYNTITDMITDNEFKGATNRIRDYIAKKYQQGEYAKLAAILLAMTLVIGMAIGATIALGGTWWYAAKKGCATIPKIAFAAAYLRDVIVPLITLSEFTFNIRNSMITCALILKKLTQPSRPNQKGFFESKREQINALGKKESWGQFFNLFRAITQLFETPFYIGFFVAHVIGIGFSTDRVKHVPRSIAAGISGGTEAFSDGHYLASDNEHDHGHDHDHGNILGWIFGFTFIGLHLLTATWAWGAGQCSNKKEHRISFTEAFQRSFWNNWLEKDKPDAPCTDQNCPAHTNEPIQNTDENYETDSNQRNQKTEKKPQTQTNNSVQCNGGNGCTHNGHNNFFNSLQAGSNPQALLCGPATNQPPQPLTLV